MVHVLESHRRKGLAKAVVAAVSRELLQSGKVPALHAYVDNEASLALFPTLGFQKVRIQVWGEAVFQGKSCRSRRTASGPARWRRSSRRRTSRASSIRASGWGRTVTNSRRTRPGTRCSKNSCKDSG